MEFITFPKFSIDRLPFLTILGSITLFNCSLSKYPLFISEDNIPAKTSTPCVLRTSNNSSSFVTPSAIISPIISVIVAIKSISFFISEDTPTKSPKSTLTSWVKLTASLIVAGVSSTVS